jgi:cholera toxin transcriptional activator
MAASRSLPLYRFATFEVDAASGELRRRGIRVKLNTQPFELLCLLLERPGEVLTRDEIAGRLWPEGTFVDFEHGVNSAINRIREALGDSAANPRFIETLARRGYRFIAPVERIPAGEEPSSVEARAALQGSPAESAPSADAPVAAGTANLEAPPPSSLPPEPGPTLRPETRRWSILATPEELPATSHAVSRTFFVLLQCMYLAFYVGALANLPEIDELLSALPRSTHAFYVLVVSAAVLIPVRAFVLSATLFRAPRAAREFLRLWPFLLPCDVLWALSPFLLLHHIHYGVALACTALLVYSPFAQRSLVLMGALEAGHSKSPKAL